MNVFVVMPFGVKDNINFDAIYQGLVKPAVEAAGLECFRADEATHSGDLRIEMFQQLLLAELVIVDLSVNNPNVWYELGVRHALRAKGVIQICSRSTKLPTDVMPERTLHYSLLDGAPDKAAIDRERNELTSYIDGFLEAPLERIESPVYSLLPSLKEPGWKDLKIDRAMGFWRDFDDWQNQVDAARMGNRTDEILKLVDDARAKPFRLEKYLAAGEALRSLGHHDLALEQYDFALRVDPSHKRLLQVKGISLERVGRHEEARQTLGHALELHGNDAETQGLLGRVEKEAWTAAWLGAPNQTEQARRHIDLLDRAIGLYRKGFVADPAQIYPGITALALYRLRRHLRRDGADGLLTPDFEGGVRFAIEAALEHDAGDYWALVSKADVLLSSGRSARVLAAYARAIQNARNDVFALRSSRDLVGLFVDLKFRLKLVTRVLVQFDAALDASPGERLGNLST